MVVIVGVFGASVSAAQTQTNLISADTLGMAQQVPVDGDGAEPTGDDAEWVDSATEVVALEAELDARDEQIATLQEQLVFMQQVLIEVQAHNDLEKDRLVQSLTLEASSQAESMEQWRMGYAIGGGESLSAFETVILPCESGSEPDPDMAVGPTDDWGRAQINRPTWKDRFESLTGSEFESNITNPMLNGFMAAHVEQEQGLSAWTCWRRR